MAKKIIKPDSIASFVVTLSTQKNIYGGPSVLILFTKYSLHNPPIENKYIEMTPGPQAGSAKHLKDNKLTRQCRERLFVFGYSFPQLKGHSKVAPLGS